jgi:hypothetical protein
MMGKEARISGKQRSSLHAVYIYIYHKQGSKSKGFFFVLLDTSKTQNSVPKSKTGTMDKRSVAAAQRDPDPTLNSDSAFFF